MIWVDAHLSPALSRWITAELQHPAQAVRELGLRQAKDPQIFAAARQAGVIILTKDADFAEMVERLGPPRARSLARSVSSAWFNPAPANMPRADRIGSSPAERLSPLCTPATPATPSMFVPFGRRGRSGLVRLRRRRSWLGFFIMLHRPAHDGHHRHAAGEQEPRRQDPK